MRAIHGRRVILTSALVLLIVIVLSSGIGSVRIPSGDVVRIFLSRVELLGLVRDWPETHEMILWNIRWPRVALAITAGMALSVAGAAYQGLFKNPLADPYVLGVSAGAALGGSIAMAFLGQLQIKILGPVPMLAFLGGLGAVTLVYRLAAVGRRTPLVTLLLAGVAVGSLCISLVSVILFMTNSGARDAIIFWMMGGLGAANWNKVGLLLPYLGMGFTVMMVYSRQLNALLLGDEQAQHLGVDVERVKRVIMVAGTLLTAAAVAFCGTIGFVGLIVPHIARMLVGPDHRLLLPASALIGGVVLLSADTVARAAFGTTEVPVGLVMAVAGGPFFLWLLRRKLKPVGV